MAVLLQIIPTSQDSTFDIPNEPREAKIPEVAVPEGSSSEVSSVGTVLWHLILKSY